MEALEQAEHRQLGAAVVQFGGGPQTAGAVLAALLRVPVERRGRAAPRHRDQAGGLHGDAVRLGPVVAVVVVVARLDVVLGPPQRQPVGTLPHPLAHVGELIGGGELVGDQLVVGGVAGAVHDHEVGTGLVLVPVVEGVEHPLVRAAPVTLELVGGVLALARVETVHHQVRATDENVLVDLLQLAVHQVVQLGVALVVPAFLGVVPEPLELVPDDEVPYIRIALGHGRGELGEVLEVPGVGRGLEPVPVGVVDTGLAALHPVRGAAQGHHGGAAGGADEVHARVHLTEPVTARRGFGVVRAPAHDVLQLRQARSGEGLLGALDRAVLPLVRAVLGVRETPAELGLGPFGGDRGRTPHLVAVGRRTGGRTLAVGQVAERQDQRQCRQTHAEQRGEPPPPCPRFPPMTSHQRARVIGPVDGMTGSGATGV